MTYSCTSEYTLSGMATVSCLASGNWSSLPTCTGKITSNSRLLRKGFVLHVTYYSLQLEVLGICIITPPLCLYDSPAKNN